MLFEDRLGVLSTLGLRALKAPAALVGTRPGKRRWEGEGAGAMGGLSMVYSTPILRRMARRGVLCTWSVLGTPGLGRGAGVGALFTIL